MVFGPGVTTIVGPSDTGKSAIIRALRWVCQNTPAGLAHRRHGAKSVSVALLFDDGRQVKRTRSDSENRYWLDDAEFASFGNEVPAPVAGALQIGEHNFQAQHDSPYWLAAPGSQVSRELNAIIDLQIVDDVSAFLTAKTRQAIATVDVVKDRLTAAKAALKELEGVPAMVQAVSRLERLQKIAKEAANEAGPAGEMVRQVESTAKAVEGISAEYWATFKLMGKAAAASNAAQAAARFSELLESLRVSYKASRVTVPDVSKLSKLSEKAQKTKTAAALLFSVLGGAVNAAKLAGVQIPPSDCFARLDDLIQKTRAKKMAVRQIIEMIETAFQLFINTRECAIKLEVAQTEFAELPGICPTCQRPLES